MVPTPSPIARRASRFWSTLASAALVVVLLAAAALSAHATLVRGFSLRGLTAESHSITRGVVIDQEAVWDQERRRVYTISTVRVDRSHRGDATGGEQIYLKQMGGTAEGITQLLAGRAPIELGDEVLLFTRTDGAFHYLVGMAQGAWLVVRDESGRTQIRRTGARINATPLPYVAARKAPTRTSLERFEATLAKILASLVEEEVAP